ncbi:MAG TPA: N-acetylmuramoyl-L-alanine amidase [Candidatus Polarisedimenticolia bacterium]|jgi:N-acetylmuramoyl-L-alanine amidase
MPRGRGCARASVLVAALLLPHPALTPARAASTRRAPVAGSVVATLEKANGIFLEVQAGPRDSYISLAVAYAGSERRWADIEKANAGRPVRPGLFYAIPFEILSAGERARCLVALFPGDGPGDEAWVHRVPEGDDGQTLESVALWFTGDASLADDLAESNGIEWAPLSAGAEVTIPAAILSPVFLKTPPPEPAPPPVPRKPALPVKAGDLTFMDDGAASYAVYRLKAGEALYSAVVARFTGRLDPDDVSAVAARIVQLSGIKKLTSIPIGYPVKIPRDLILPEHLPQGDPLREKYEKGLAAAERHQITTRARDLGGITIILDAGHGGDDVGAQRNGVHEDDYVFDIVCRIKELAERTTAARVLTTIKDRSSGFAPQEGPFGVDRDEFLLTTPVYFPRQPHVATVGVNLRWYLVNSYFRSAIAAGANPERIVFVSVHADSLHPSVRGAMVYVPGQGYRTGTYGHVGRMYDRKEVGELRYVKFSTGERETAEGLSRRLAARLIAAFTAAGLPVHAYEPIRDHVIRRRRSWTPAVIRTSLVPQSLLLEVVNLNNNEDAALLKRASFRQKVAEAFLDALRRHYSAGAPPTTTAAGKAR